MPGMRANPDAGEATTKLQRDLDRLDRAVKRLNEASSFAKFSYTSEVLEAVRRVLAQPGGTEAVYQRIGSLTDAGIFAESDWAHPEELQPAMAANTLRLGHGTPVLLECLSELRLLAVARGERAEPGLDVASAEAFLTQVLASNVALILGAAGEAERIHLGRNLELVQEHQRFVAECLGLGVVIEAIIAEIWRILAQRPIDVEPVKTMITRLAVELHAGEAEVPAARARGAERLISALFGPTRGCQEDPGLEVYRGRIAALDEAALRNEAIGFGRAMHDTGLVSAYHVVFLHYALEQAPHLIATALGLSSTGADALGCYADLVHTLIREAITPATAQGVYGLSGLLERGVLYNGPVAPALWRQLSLPLAPGAVARLQRLPGGTAVAPQVLLLAGVLNLLGQPRGVGQGNNPTCQSARALALWSTTDPDYLLQVVAWAARDDDVVAHFEGQSLSSAQLLATYPAADLDPVDAVSAVTVPHLDALYHEMGRRCADRGQDPHRWVNPELHGWWVGRGFAIAVDINTGTLIDGYSDFLRCFYGAYHPAYNGNHPVIHPQPAGVAVTDASARFVGWHAITIERVAIDPEGVVRVYFLNPNNDSTQDWGDGVQVTTEGNGERHGESSLPFGLFASRLYIFHYDPREIVHDAPVLDSELDQVLEAARRSWAADRWPGARRDA